MHQISLFSGSYRPPLSFYSLKPGSFALWSAKVKLEVIILLTDPSHNGTGVIVCMAVVHNEIIPVSLLRKDFQNRLARNTLPSHF